MDLKNKRILVTGSGGFIGSHLTEELVRLGAEVSSLIHYNSEDRWGFIDDFPKEVKDQISIVTGDLKDSDCVRNAVRGKDIIFHLGANIAIPYSYLNPRDTIETNILGTLNVLTAAREFEVQKIIHTSTSEVYGTAQYLPIDEKHPLKGQSPYAASKIGADKIAESFFLSYNLPVAIIRPFNTYGPRQSARAIIPTIITQALTQDHIRLGSLTPKRDFTYVKDTVQGFIKAAESDKSKGEVINIGSNSEISVSELKKLISDIIGKEFRIILDEQRVRPEESEVMHLRCDNSKAKELLGWQPQYSIKDGLKETISWIQKNLDRYKIGRYTT